MISPTPRFPAPIPGGKPSSPEYERERRPCPDCGKSVRWHWRSPNRFGKRLLVLDGDAPRPLTCITAYSCGDCGTVVYVAESVASS